MQYQASAPLSSDMCTLLSHIVIIKNSKLYSNDSKYIFSVFCVPVIRWLAGFEQLEIYQTNKKKPNYRTAKTIYL